MLASKEHRRLGPISFLFLSLAKPTLGFDIDFNQNFDENFNKNILLVNPTKKLRVGIKLLAEYFSNSGVEVVLLTPEKPDYNLKNVEIIVYPSFFVPRVRYTIPNFLKQIKILKKVIRRYDIGIVQIFSYFYPAVWLPVLYSSKLGIPVILTTDSFPGISWSYGSRFVDFFARTYTKTVGKIVLANCDKVVLLHTKIIKDLLDLGISEKKIIVIPNGVNFKKFEKITDKKSVRIDLGIKKNELMLLNVGRLVPVKGVERLIWLAQKLKDDRIKFKLVIVGDGPPTYVSKYKKLAIRVGVEDNVIFTGFRNDIPDLISACDVFLLPSLSEGLPTAVLEAGAVGKLTITSNVGGVMDIITGDRMGYVVDDFPIEAINYIKEISSDRSGKLKMSLQFNKKIKRSFNWEKLIMKYISLYDSFKFR